MANPVRIVLVNPTHPGNIGAVARAMKNMGLTALYLVSPAQFPHFQATIRASGADDILSSATVVNTLEEAIRDCQLVYGTSARTRSLPWPTCTPRVCAQTIMNAGDQSTAIVFGREASGLSNDELALCHYHIHIPCNDQFSSLNLSAAVQIIAYELQLASLSQQTIPAAEETIASHADKLATVEAVSGFLKHLESLLIDIEFLDSKHPKRLLARLQRLFNRTRLEEKEIHILRGILSTIEKRLFSL